MASRFHQRRWAAAALVLPAVALLAVTSCSAGQGADGRAGSSSPSTTAAGPLTVEISQFRDNYSRQIIELQLTNTTGGPVTVLAAAVRSPLFASGITWRAAGTGTGTELPPGQTKSLPARLPDASCAEPPEPPGSPGRTAGPPPAVVEVLLAPAAGTPGLTVTTDAADPFGVLPRNNSELCLAQAAAAVADLRLSPELELAPDGRAAVLHLVITPRNGTAAPAERFLTINSVGGTTLLAEDSGAPWPAGLRVDAAGPVQELRLGIRPARCDPHAVAEDKVGTLIPLRITTAGREGMLKLDAGGQLRGRIYEFVTSACGRQ